MCTSVSACLYVHSTALQSSSQGISQTNEGSVVSPAVVIGAVGRGWSTDGGLSQPTAYRLGRCWPLACITYRESPSACAGMHSLSKFCIAVSATRKLNCVAGGVICVAVFLVCFGEKIMLNSVTLSRLNQSRELNIMKKKDSPSAAAMK